MPQFSPGETYIPLSTCRLSQTSFETINKNALGIPLAWRNQGTRHRLSLSLSTASCNTLAAPPPRALLLEHHTMSHAKPERRSSVSAHTRVAHLAHTLVALLGSLRLPQTLASRHTLVAHLASRRHLPLAEPPAASCTHPPREGPGTHSLLLYFSPLPALLARADKIVCFWHL